MAIIDELSDSGDFDFGPQGGNGVISFFVLQANTHDEAVDAALADPRAAESINGYQRGKVAVSYQGGQYYQVRIDYQKGVPTKADANAGQSPAGQQTPGKDPHEQLPRDISFSTAGGTRRIYKSIRTVAGYGRNGGLAPNFHKLIGVDTRGGVAKVEGVEILDATSDFTITKRFSYLTVGWFRSMLTLATNTNDAPFLGLDTGEVLFKGTDGQFKDDDKTGYPWTVTGRFGFKPNKNITDNEDELTLGPDDDVTKQIRVTEVRGHQWLWAIYATEEETVGGVPCLVARPKYAYVEVVYPEGDLGKLGLN